MAYIHCQTSDSNPGMVINPKKIDTVVIGDQGHDRDPDVSLCNVNMFCIV